MSQIRQRRRQFIQPSAAVAAAVGLPYIIPPTALGSTSSVAASDRINVGAIGVGERGNAVLGAFLNDSSAHVVAVCDVETNCLNSTADRVDRYYKTKGCKRYSDYRELIARDDIDAVSIATTDHWHVLCAIAAAKAGKHIYLEKPMGLSIAEDQALRKAVNRYGVSFQFGTQQRSSGQFRLACEMVRNGIIGKLHTINVWSPSSEIKGAIEPAGIPDGLDYDMWLGPAPYTPYTVDRCASQASRKAWWFNSDYALGFIAGWGIHPLDIALWGGHDKLTGPITVSGTGTIPDQGLCNTATQWDINLEYSTGVRIHFTSDPVIDEWKNRYGRIANHGTVFEGTDGWVHVDRAGINVSSQSYFQALKDPAVKHLPVSNNHVGNLLKSIKTGNKTICPIEDSVQSDILCHISDIAIRRRQKLVWNTRTELFDNSLGANRMLTRSMRSPWHL